MSHVDATYSNGNYSNISDVTGIDDPFQSFFDLPTHEHLPTDSPFQFDAPHYTSSSFVPQQTAQKAKGEGVKSPDTVMKSTGAELILENPEQISLSVLRHVMQRTDVEKIEVFADVSVISHGPMNHLNSFSWKISPKLSNSSPAPAPSRIAKNNVSKPTSPRKRRQSATVGRRA